MTAFRLTKPHYLRRGKEGESGTEVYVEAGEVIDWRGPPTLGMEGVDDDGIAKCKERDEKRKNAQQQAVAQGRMSKVMAENIGPKTEPPPPEHDDDRDDSDDSDDPHPRGKRPKR
jgi:hypothetical protein